MWIKKFTVRGTWGFPLDMLRYDGCWPSSSEDVAAIHSSVRAGAPPHGAIEVTLTTCGYAKHNANQYPTHERWKSFGWKVINEDNPYKV